MRSKWKRAQTIAEGKHVLRLKELGCIVCNESPVEIHEPEQGMWWISIPLCPACHRGPDGWHGTRKRWALRKMTELKAINQTLEEVYG